MIKEWELGTSGVFELIEGPSFCETQKSLDQLLAELKEKLNAREKNRTLV